jgi:type IV pilus assembly protein PilB
LNTRKQIGQILKALGAVTDEQIDKALEFSKSNSCRIGEAMVKTGACPQKTLSRALAKQFGLPFADLANKVIPKELIALVPKEVAIEHRAIPVGKKDGKLFVAMTDLDFMALDNLRFLLNQPVECAIASPEDIDDAIDSYYRLTGNLGEVLGDNPDQITVGRGDYSGEEAEANDAPVIKYVTQLISNAIKERASDIHVECASGTGSTACRWRRRTRPRSSRGRSSPASRSCPGWTWPRSAGRRTAASRSTSMAGRSTCASPRFPAGTARAWS